MRYLSGVKKGGRNGSALLPVSLFFLFFSLLLLFLLKRARHLCIYCFNIHLFLTSVDAFRVMGTSNMRAQLLFFFLILLLLLLFGYDRRLLSADTHPFYFSLFLLIPPLSARMHMHVLVSVTKGNVRRSPVVHFYM